MQTAGVAVLLAASVALFAVSGASAQSFQNYRCSDGTQFIVGWAHLQIDGREVTMSKRLALSRARDSGSGVTLKIGKAGTMVRHARQPATACELS